MPGISDLTLLGQPPSQLSLAQSWKIGFARSELCRFQSFKGNLMIRPPEFIANKRCFFRWSKSQVDATAAAIAVVNVCR